VINLSGVQICFLAGTLGQGGAERQLYYILRSVSQLGIKPQVLCFSRGEFWEDKIRELGISVTWVGQHKTKVLRLFRILSLLRANPPDIIQSQHAYTNLYAAITARLLHTREIGAIRSDAIHEIHDIGILGYPSLSMPRIVIANSQSAIENAINARVPAKHLHYLPNVVDTEQFRPRIKREKNAILHIIAVGSLEKPKRFDRFIRAISRLRYLGKQIKGIVIGDGALRTQLEQQVLDLGFGTLDIEFKGRISDMAPVYRDGDILVSTSDWEGTPNVVLEAMASGMPVVATNVGGIREIVHHGETGFLCEPENEKTLTDNILRLIDDTQLRSDMGCRAREHVVGHHSLSHLPLALGELYKVVFS
jgi:glycosyltransferase involved in cell wall biosynthesis